MKEPCLIFEIQRIKFGRLGETVYICNKTWHMKWFENLPVACPPSDATSCNGVFYRIAGGNPATSPDFFSQKKLQPNKIFVGKGVNECIARAVSLFKEKEDAQKRLKLPKFKHSVIAAVELEPKDGKMKKTFRDSHYSWWRSTNFDVTQAKVEEE